MQRYSDSINLYLPPFITVGYTFLSTGCLRSWPICFNESWSGVYRESKHRPLIALQEYGTNHPSGVYLVYWLRPYECFLEIC